MSRCTKKNCPMVGVSADCDLKDCLYRTEAKPNFEIIVNGNCPICGKPLSGRWIFSCEECSKKMETIKDTIYREDAIEAIHSYWKGELSKMPTTDSEYGEVIDGDCDTLLKHNKELSTRIKDIPSADRPSEIIYGNEYNCIMTIFGECSYAETGCGDCAVVEKVRKALSADRPQGEWIEKPHKVYLPRDCEPDITDYHDCQYNEEDHSIIEYWWHCNQCDYEADRLFKPIFNFCPNCGADMRERKESE